MNRSLRNLLIVALATLLWWAFIHVQPAEGGEGHFVVVSHPPRLSVEAEGVKLPQVLQAIGAKVGFTVVDKGVSRQVLTISMKDTTLDEVLRQLLRSENHVIIYRGGVEGRRGGTIDRILLFGPQAYAEDAPDPREWRPVQNRHADIPQAHVELNQSADSAAMAQSTTTFFQEGRQPRYGLGGGENGDITVADLLRAHAILGVRDLSGDIPSATSSGPVNRPLESTARTAGEGPTSGMSTSALPSDIDETLAMTTRQAQQHLKALIDGLETATRSWLDSSADERR